MTPSPRAGSGPAIALHTKLGTREDVMHFDIAPGEPVAGDSTAEGHKA